MEKNLPHVAIVQNCCCDSTGDPVLHPCAEVGVGMA